MSEERTRSSQNSYETLMTLTKFLVLLVLVILRPLRSFNISDNTRSHSHKLNMCLPSCDSKHFKFCYFVKLLTIFSVCNPTLCIHNNNIFNPMLLKYLSYKYLYRLSTLLRKTSITYYIITIILNIITILSGNYPTPKISQNINCSSTNQNNYIKMRDSTYKETHPSEKNYTKWPS